MAMSPGVKWVAAGWTYFIAENLILSENRTAIIDYIGDKGYHGAYSFCSLTSMGSVAYGFMKYRTGARAGGVRRVAGVALGAMGVAGISQGMPALRNISEFGQGDAKSFCPIDLGWKKSVEGKEVHGLQRITRHPQLWSLSTLGMGSALATACPVTAVTGLGLLPVAIILGAHQDSRYARSIGGTRSEYIKENTSHLPFHAVATGHQSLSTAWCEAKQTNAAAAALIYSVMMCF